MAESAEELAERLAGLEVEFAPGLAQQLVQGDFWDNNVGFRRGRPVLVADFDFVGERPRIDDLALTLYFALLDLARGDVSQDTLGRLASLVARYESGLDIALSAYMSTMVSPCGLARFFAAQTASWW